MSPLLITTLLGLCVLARGQVPIPKRKVGFVYMDGSPSAPVHIDFYIDQICPYSKAAWPTLLKLAEDYGPSNLQLTVHSFPLPYHRNAFLTAKGAHIVDKVTNGEHTFHWIKIIFSNMDYLTTNATKLLSDDEIIDALANMVKDVEVDASTFTSLMEDVEIEITARIGWKYCCSRGISGTPTFMVNDVFIPASYAWNLTTWKNIIDPLLDGKDDANLLNSPS